MNKFFSLFRQCFPLSTLKGVFRRQLPDPDGEESPARDVIRSNEFRLVLVRDDARCLFRAVVKAVYNRQGRPLSETKETEIADELRDCTVSMISGALRREMVERNLIEGDIDQYIERCKSRSFYAGFSEVFAISMLLEVCIRVFSSVDEIDVHEVYSAGSMFVACLDGSMSSEHGVINLFLSERHYDVLIRKD